VIGKIAERIIPQLRSKILVEGEKAVESRLFPLTGLGFSF
jgi:hypothetical protein